MTKIEQILKKKETLEEDNIQRGYKEGIEIEKGVVLNEDYLIKNQREIGDLMSIFSAYPDTFLDLITPENSNF